jgi:hypothetical protein
MMVKGQWVRRRVKGLVSDGRVVRLTPVEMERDEIAGSSASVDRTIAIHEEGEVVVTFAGLDGRRDSCWPHGLPLTMAVIVSPARA